MKPLRDDLKDLSSAEDFFAYFDVGYEPRVLAASRLHILKRFHDNLGKIAGLDDLPLDEQRRSYRAALEQAYADYTAAPAVTLGAFPALERVRGAFVPLAAISLQRHRP